MGVVQRVVNRIPGGELGRGVATLVAGTTLAQAIVVGSSPILTRLYSPADVGTYSVAVSIVAILVTVSCLSYQFAVPLPDTDVEAANVLGLCFAVIAVGTLASASLAWLAGPSLLAVLGAATLAPYALLLPLGQLGGAAVSALTYWAIRAKNFPAIAATSLTQSGTIAAVQVGLGLAGVGAVGMVVGDVAGRFSGSGRLARAAWRSHSTALRSISGAGMLAAARRYRRFPIFSMPSAIVNTVGLQAPLLLLVALYGSGTGGQFALADRLCGLPVTLLATAVGRVFFAEAARMHREEPGALRDLFAGATRSLARGAIVPFVLLAALAPLLAGLVFGAAWSEAGLFVTVLAPMYFIILVTNPTGSTLDVLERQDLQLLLGLLRLALFCGAVLAATALQLPPIGAVAVLSAAGCLTYAAYGLGSWRAIGAGDAARAGAAPTAPAAAGSPEGPGVPRP